ncbi:caspase family protein [Bradyrhizobium lablabi]|uniref:caspase family protein n=1 Tax=Bradyrhizobium lablabi TaxID=722472 RepID=UPI001BA8C4FE|nr:caspase family protein [Bradyrhizobium lablabi]MBR0695622.1 caspase family protein [Bradyrhizobium lablabi]
MPSVLRVVGFGLLFALQLVVESAWAQGSATKRVALIVGNGSYRYVASLSNPPNDASDIGDAFKRVGFKVSRLLNVDRLEFLRALRAFEDEALEADIAIVFYAGHGIEIDGSNFLIPIDAKLERDTHVEDEAIPLNRVLQAVAGAKTLRLVFLDACRANNFESTMKRTIASRAVGRGLNNLQPVGSTVVAYSAKQGTLAEDGIGRNSPFASSLLAHIEQQNLEINFLLRAIRDDVLKATNRRQEPYTYGSLGAERIFLNGQTDTTNTADEAAWNFLDKSSVKDLQKFIRQFPTSDYRSKAEAAISALGEERCPDGSVRSPTGECKPSPSRAPASTGSLMVPGKCFEMKGKRYC